MGWALVTAGISKQRTSELSYLWQDCVGPASRCAAQRLEGERSRGNQTLTYILFLQYLPREMCSCLLPRCLGFGGVIFGGEWESHFYSGKTNEDPHQRGYICPFLTSHPFPGGKPFQMSQLCARLQSAGCEPLIFRIKEKQENTGCLFLSPGLTISSFIQGYWLLVLSRPRTLTSLFCV